MNAEPTVVPLVSIIVPVYNVEEFLPGCLESILAQTYREIEVICVDDGSSDSSGEILHSYACSDTRMVVLCQKNEGAAIARNNALAYAQGEYVIFVDSDDMVDPCLVEKTVKRAIEASAEIVLFRFFGLDTETNESNLSRSSLDLSLLPECDVFRGRDVPNLFMATLPNIWTKLYKTSYLIEYNLISFPKLAFAEDVPFTYTALAQANRIAVVDEALYCYRRNRSNSVSNIARNDDDTIIQSLLTLKRQLSDRALLDTFQKTFNHRCVSSIWHELHLGTEPDRLARQLSDYGLKEIGLCGLAEDAFYSKSAFKQYEETLQFIRLPLTEKTLLTSDYFNYVKSKTDAATIAYNLRLVFHDSVDKLADALTVNNEAGWGIAHEKSDIKCIAMFYQKVCHGGAERVIAQLAEAFVDQGKRVILFTEDPPSTDDFFYPESATRILLPDFREATKYHQRAQIINDAVAEYRIDLAIHHRWNSPLSFWDALVIKTAGAKFAVYCHNFFLNPVYWNGYDSIRTLAKTYGLYDCIITLSSVDREYWACFNHNVQFIHNPALELVNSYNNSQGKMSAGACCKTLLWVGRLSWEKQYWDLIPIMKTVADKMPEVKLFVLGTAENAEELARFNRAIVDNGLEDTIILEGWQKDITHYLKSVNLMLSTSLFEGWSLNIYEAMAYGVPVIAYDCPNLEIHRCSKGVITIARKDTKAFAEQIITILSHNVLLDELRNAALEYSQKESCYDHHAAWQKIWESLRDRASLEPPNTNAAPRSLRYLPYRTLMMKMLFDTYKYDYISPEDSAQIVNRKVDEALDASLSYRLGRAITWLPRQVLYIIHHK